MNIKVFFEKTGILGLYRTYRKHKRQKYYNSLSDKEHLDILFMNCFKRHIDWENPKTFNEKLQWLKINDRNPEHTKMVDKYEVREYISKTIGEEYLIPLLGVWNNVDDINFDELPEKFVLKCTHGSACNIICPDKSKLNIKEAKKKLKKWMKINYYYLSREWPYKNVKPRIIAEKFMVDSKSDDLKDYKFFCFNGNVKCSFVASERDKDLKVTFFDKQWNVLPFERSHPKSDIEISKPINYEKMVDLAEKLSKDEKFIRVDFYEINKNIYFGELTYYPGAGFEAFQPEEYDYKLGEWIVLDKTAN